MNAIHPGYIDTEMADYGQSSKGKRTKKLVKPIRLAV